MKTIDLSKGFVTIVDDEDYEKFSKLRWHVAENRKGSRNKYAVGRPNGARREYLHRLIMPNSDGRMIDHINGDTLDNRRSNLRYSSASENQYNRFKNSKYAGITPVSKYKGVCRKGTRYMARIGSSYIGIFDTEEEAAIAYNLEAKARFGEFAKLNTLPMFGEDE